MNSILITGCNRGLGLGLIKNLLGVHVPPAHVFATCRNLQKAEASVFLISLSLLFLYLPGTGAMFSIVQKNVDRLSVCSTVLSRIATKDINFFPNKNKTQKFRFEFTLLRRTREYNFVKWFAVTFRPLISTLINFQKFFFHSDGNIQNE